MRGAARQARRALDVARGRIRWRALGVATGCLVVLVAVVAAIGQSFVREPVAVQHSTSAMPPPVMTAAGPAPGSLLPLWQVTTANVPGQSAPGGQVDYGIVDGQLVIVSAAGLDVRDPRTGSPRWHYYRPGWRLTGWSDTRAGIAAFFEHVGGPAGHLLVALDAATGRALWQSPRDAPVGTGPGSLRWLSGPGTFLVTVDGRAVQAVTASRGLTVWSRRLPPSCSLSPSALYGKDGDDTTVDVLSAACPTGGLVLAVSPADGRIRWSLHARAAIADAISVQHGITALWDGRTLQVRTADGRTLLRAEGDSLCGDLCQIVVAAGRVLLGYSPGRSTQLLRAVEVSSGRTAWSRQVATYQAMTEAGGRVYALSNALADGLLPAALDVIDPLSGQLTVVPLPLAFRSGAGDRPWLAAAGGLLLVGYPLEFAGPAGGYRVIALRSAPAGAGPVLLGGVSPADWPDACRLISGEELTTVIPAAGYKITPDRVVIAGLRLSAGCEYQSVAANGDAAEVDVSIGWVAVTARQAALLLADVRATYQEAEPLPRLGDEAYALGTPVGPVAVRVGRVIIVVSADQSPGATTELARFAVLRLRQRGS